MSTNETTQFTPHLNADVIKAWADGKTLQYRPNNKWYLWNDYDKNKSYFGPWDLLGYEWRVKLG